MRVGARRWLCCATCARCGAQTQSAQLHASASSRLELCKTVNARHLPAACLNLQAQAARNMLNVYTPAGESMPIVVKFADSAEDKQRKVVSSAWNRLALMSECGCYYKKCT